MKIKMISGLVLIFLVVIFTLQNTEVVSIKFLLWEFSMSRVLMFFLILAVGVVTGFLLGSYRKSKVSDTGPIETGDQQLP